MGSPPNKLCSAFSPPAELPIATIVEEFLGGAEPGLEPCVEGVAVRFGFALFAIDAASIIGVRGQKCATAELIMRRSGCGGLA